MSTLNDITEKELTLREAKSILTKLMLEFKPEIPVLLTLKTGREERTFELVPKRTRRSPNGTAFAIHEIPYDALEDTTDVGVYIAKDDLSITGNGFAECYYGLYINFEQQRDLRFFNNRESCLKWLDKKLKILEK